MAASITNKFILDLGGSTAKFGKMVDKRPRVIHLNAIARQKPHPGRIYGSDVPNLPSYSNLSFRRPIERGYLVDCDLQCDILKRIFDTTPWLKPVDMPNSMITVTKPPFFPRTLQKDLCEMLFESMGFGGVLLLSTPFCNLVGYCRQIQYTRHSHRNAAAAAVAAKIAAVEAPPDAPDAAQTLEAAAAATAPSDARLRSPASGKERGSSGNSQAVRQAESGSSSPLSPSGSGGSESTSDPSIPPAASQAIPISPTRKRKKDKTPADAPLPTIVKFKSALVVDSGFSFSHVSPVIDHLVQRDFVRRIDVGGKVMTNKLQDLVSLRYFDVRDETYVIQHMKEATCYVSQNFAQDLRERLHLRTRFVLPNYTDSKLGYCKALSQPINVRQEQFVPLSTERIAIPELLFHPSDVGIDQGGVVETIVESVESMSSVHHRALMYDTVLLTGGNTNLKGYVERVQSDLRAMVPAEYGITIAVPQDPIVNCWQGARTYTSQDDMRKWWVPKWEWEDEGSRIAERRFVL